MNVKIMELKHTILDKNAEIDRLKGELEEAQRYITALRLERDGAVSIEDNTFKRCNALQQQLSEARAELESIGYKPLAAIKEEARQEAARECLEILDTRLVIHGQANRNQVVAEIKAKFKLEGGEE